MSDWNGDFIIPIYGLKDGLNTLYGEIDISSPLILPVPEVAYIPPETQIASVFEKRTLQTGPVLLSSGENKLPPPKKYKTPPIKIYKAFITLDTPKNGQTFTVNEDIPVSGDTLASQNVEIVLDGADSHMTQSDANGKYVLNLGKLSPGEHTISAYLLNAHGGRENQAGPITITVLAQQDGGNTPPSPPVTPPSAPVTPSTPTSSGGG